jgi:hypothetical protein
VRFQITKVFAHYLVAFGYWKAALCNGAFRRGEGRVSTARSVVASNCGTDTQASNHSFTVTVNAQ